MNRDPLARMSGERGVALVLSLFLVMAMSVIAASVMFLAQTETYGTMNYRMMSQARYAAESGVHKTANYLLSTAYQSIKPGTASDALDLYDTTVSPVKLKSNGKEVVLSAFTSQTSSCPTASNYANAAVITAFTSGSTAPKGTLAAGSANIQYVACARLMSMQMTESKDVVQRWEITAVGTVGGARPATEEVTATLETQIVPTHGYSAFATAASCGAITLQGGAITDSYDSTAYTGNGSTQPATAAADADIGTNGNLSEGGNGTIINGRLYTPRHGVGNCNSGNITALSQSGGAIVTGGVVEMPQTWTPPAPVIVVPSPAPPTTALSIDGTTTCTTAAFKAAYEASGATCSLVNSGGVNYLTVKPNGAAPISWGNVSITNGAKVTFLPGTYNFNSLSVSQNTTRLNIGDPQPVGTATSGTVTMTLVGTDASKTVDISSSGTLAVPSNKQTNFVMNLGTSNQSNNTPLNVTGGGVFENQTYDPQRFIINYAGTAASSVSGGAATAFVLNAPNADLTLTGGSDFYGSLIVKTLKNTGGTKLHYDKNLGSFFGVAGNPLLSSFTWKRF
jgi:Tfp pilus assembly protein PilX